MRAKFILFSIVLALLAGTTGAQAAVGLTATAHITPGMPGTVSGTGFGANEAVDIYVDNTDIRLVAASATGTFGTPLAFCTCYTPGAHFITAIGRKSGTAAQATTTFNEPWRQFGFGPAHYGFNPYENTIGQNEASQLGVLWSSSVAPGSGATPAISPTAVYVSTKAGIEALDRSTGAAFWRVLTGETFYSSPIMNGSVFVGSFTTGNVYALNASTGATVWTRNLGGPIYSSPTLVGSTIYIACYCSGAPNVFALNSSNGAVIWSKTVGTGKIESTPTLAGDKIIIGSLDGNVYAVNASTGAQVWNYLTYGPIEGTPAASNGIIYITSPGQSGGSGGGTLFAIQASTGALVWSSGLGREVHKSSLAVAGRTLYFVESAVANDSAYVEAYNADYGSYVSSKYLALGPVEGGSASVANGVVYITDSNGDFVALSASNLATVLLRGAPGGTTYGAPAISDGVVYLDTDGGATYAFAPTAGPMSARAKRAPHRPKPSELHPDMSLTLSR